ncbi:MAG TPA: hypothetical protein VFF81_08435 [Noviherbaspirillum sp.]|nr:hypothetical protein [Noviherbaspirillum sp.]
MTPNLASARKAIEAELAHAIRGIDYYAARVEALETALSQLDSVDVDVGSADRTGRGKRAGAAAQKSTDAKRTRRSRAARAKGSVNSKGDKASSKATHGGKSRAGARTDDGLPTTGADFWLNLITDEPQSAVAIATSAVKALGLKSDQNEPVKKLKQRVAPALAALVAAGKVQDTGAGRERRYFKSAEGAA